MKNDARESVEEGRILNLLRRQVINPCSQTPLFPSCPDVLQNSKILLPLMTVNQSSDSETTSLLNNIKRINLYKFC